MTDAYIVGGARTPIGAFGGSLREHNAPMLLEHAFRAGLEKTRIPAHEIDEVIVGQVFQGSDAPNIARFSALRAGLPQDIPGVTLNRQCASGLEAAVWAAKNIRAGESELVLTGGVESMSTVPYLIRGARWGLKLGPQFLIDGMIELGDDPAAAGMWIWAENMAERFEISREEQDRWAALSHARALAAASAGRFDDEIAPVEIVEKKGTRTLARDENPRVDATPDTLARLQPRFKYDGTITPGNASPLNDGAACTFIASRDKAATLGLAQIARIRAWAIVGIDPEITGYAPVYAIPAALKKAGLEIGDIDLFEINEAFAVMMVATVRDLNLDPDKVNVNGGALAMGHPVGMSGNRILFSLARQLQKQGAQFGVASLCAGGGLGIAVVLEAVAA
jgi:acetyl-CoA C-acetyltransferase